MHDVDAEAQAAVVLDRHAPEKSIDRAFAELFGDQSFDLERMAQVVHVRHEDVPRFACPGG